MSWNEQLAKEAYEDGPWLDLKRLKTGKEIRVQYEPHEYPEIITPLDLSYGEILEDSHGTQIQIEGCLNYEFRVYEVSFVKSRSDK